SVRRPRRSRPRRMGVLRATHPADRRPHCHWVDSVLGGDALTDRPDDQADHPGRRRHCGDSLAVVVGRVVTGADRAAAVTDALSYAREMCEEGERRVEADAWRQFRAFPRPYPKQQQFVENDALREDLLVGGNRSGKTIALCARVARRLRSGAARLIWVVSPSNAMSRQNIAPQLYEGAPGIVPFIPKTEIAAIRTTPDLEVLGYDGWRCVLKSCEQGRDKYAGAAVDEVDFDEPPTWPIYNECAIRFGANKRCL